jgi:hypothetical protein
VLKLPFKTTNEIPGWHKPEMWVNIPCGAYRPDIYSVKKGQLIVLPVSQSNLIEFGKITEILACKKYAYFIYQKMTTTHCTLTDLYFVEEQENYEFIPSHQLGCFRPLESYEVGQSKRMSVSLRNNIFI